jgi:putative glutathione S-transferase
VRFESAYRDAMRCTLRPLSAYPFLVAHRERLLALPGVADTVRQDHVRRHYHDVLGEVDPAIVPLGPQAARATDGAATGAGERP